MKALFSLNKQRERDVYRVHRCQDELMRVHPNNAPKLLLEMVRRGWLTKKEARRIFRGERLSCAPGTESENTG